MPPSNSVTWASSRTCGPCEMIHSGVPNCVVTSGLNSSPRPSALVNTTGASTCVPRWRPRSRSTDNPGYDACAAASCMVCCTARARWAGVSAAARSMSSSSDEVKSPTTLSTSGVQWFTSEQRDVEQEARVGRPAGHRVGEGRRQRHRRCHAALPGAVEQAVAGSRIEPVPAATRCGAGRPAGRAAPTAVPAHRAAREPSRPTIADRRRSCPAAKVCWRYC